MFRYTKLTPLVFDNAIIPRNCVKIMSDKKNLNVSQNFSRNIGPETASMVSSIWSKLITEAS
jgi:hypothetical protein